MDPKLPSTARDEPSIAKGKYPMIIRTFAILAALGLAIPANAGIIDLTAPSAASAPGPIFTPLPGNRVEVIAAAWGGVVAGYQPENASALFDGLALTGQLAGGFNYTPNVQNPPERLTYTGTVNHLMADITWQAINFGDPALPGPILHGTGRVTSSDGSSEFRTDFPFNGFFTVTANLAGDQFTHLVDGAITPGQVAIPSPPIGVPLLIAGAFLALIVKRRDHRQPGDQAAEKY
jgi:hypothetical protein